MTTWRDAGMGLAGGRAALTARVLALIALGVLALGALLLGGTWALFGQDAVSDNWVGWTVVVAMWVGLASSLVAMLVAVFAGVRGQPWAQLALPLATFPSVILVIALLEAFVFE